MLYLDIAHIITTFTHNNPWVNNSYNPVIEDLVSLFYIQPLYLKFVQNCILVDFNNLLTIQFLYALPEIFMLFNLIFLILYLSLSYEYKPF